MRLASFHTRGCHNSASLFFKDDDTFAYSSVYRNAHSVPRQSWSQTWSGTYRVDEAAATVTCTNVSFNDSRQAQAQAQGQTNYDAVSFGSEAFVLRVAVTPTLSVTGELGSGDHVARVFMEPGELF